MDDRAVSTHELFSDREAYLQWLATDSVHSDRRAFEREILAELHRTKPIRFYCHAHGGFATLGDEPSPTNDALYNWREHGTCNECESITRIRLVAECLSQAATHFEEPIIYLTEQLTPLYKHLRERYASLVGSEYVLDHKERQAASLRLQTYLGDPMVKIRHEDCCALNFDDSSVHIIGSFDVLEHIPNYRIALREFYRILRLGGQLFLTAPFMPGVQETRVLARLTHNRAAPIEHLYPPEYHGNPTDPEGGVLCFQHFGWDLIDELRRVGFRTAALMEAWGKETAIFGNQTVIVATK